LDFQEIASSAIFIDGRLKVSFVCHDYLHGQDVDSVVVQEASERAVFQIEIASRSCLRGAEQCFLLSHGMLGLLNMP